MNCNEKEGGKVCRQKKPNQIIGSYLKLVFYFGVLLLYLICFHFFHSLNLKRVINADTAHDVNDSNKVNGEKTSNLEYWFCNCLKHQSIRLKLSDTWVEIKSRFDFCSRNNSIVVLVITIFTSMSMHRDGGVIQLTHREKGVNEKKMDQFYTQMCTHSNVYTFKLICIFYVLWLCDTASFFPRFHWTQFIRQTTNYYGTNNIHSKS